MMNAYIPFVHIPIQREAVLKHKPSQLFKHTNNIKTVFYAF